MENRQDDLEGTERNIRRLESMLLLETGDCKKSADGLEKRLSKLEDVSGRLDGVLDSIVQMKEGSADVDQLVQSAFMLLLSPLRSESTDASHRLKRTCVENLFRAFVEAAEHLDHLEIV